LPHRQDGWTALEETSERLRKALVRDNSTREAGERLTLIEYGVNLWTWAEPPSSGGDPVCHAGELISWESAWALGPPGEPGDGGTALGETSERLRKALVRDNSTREAGERLTLIEYGVNLWTWAEPPSSGGDPVCHAGELISWESAWALGPPGEPGEAWDGGA